MIIGYSGWSSWQTVSRAGRRAPFTPRKSSSPRFTVQRQKSPNPGRPFKSDDRTSSAFSTYQAIPDRASCTHQARSTTTSVLVQFPLPRSRMRERDRFSLRNGKCIFGSAQARCQSANRHTSIANRGNSSGGLCNQRCPERKHLALAGRLTSPLSRARGTDETTIQQCQAIAVTARRTSVHAEALEGQKHAMPSDVISERSRGLRRWH